jgi:Protein of unknown function (DUF3987)
MRAVWEAWTKLRHEIVTKPAQAALDERLKTMEPLLMDDHIEWVSRIPVKYTLWEPINEEQRDFLLNVATHKIYDDEGDVIDEVPCTVENEPDEFAPVAISRIFTDEGRAKFNEYVDAYWAKHGRYPYNVTPAGTPPQSDDILRPIQPVEDTYFKKIDALLKQAKANIGRLSFNTILSTTIEGLRGLQLLDKKYPAPLTKKSLYGLLGDFVEIAHPTTVSCREMILYQLLPIVGAILGDAYYLPYGSDKHFPSLFTLVIGRTSDGKGQSQHHVEEGIKLVDSSWVKTNLRSNAASGESLVRMMAGPTLRINNRKNRIAIHNSEMSTYFINSGRDGSTLGGFMRKAYDGDRLENFRSDSKKSITADDYLLGFVGLITPKELRKVMPQMDWTNGAQNRFLWCVGEKDKSLGRSTIRPDFSQWALRLSKLAAMNQSTDPTSIDYSESGRRAWDAWFESLPEHDDSILADSQARIAANCARVAVLYAQLDERRFEGWQVAIEEQHVEAAIEIVTRSRQSVEWYLLQQNGTEATVSPGDVQKVKRALTDKVRSSGDAALTSSDIHKLFTNKSASERDEICIAAGLKASSRKTQGRAAMIWTE